MTHVQTGFSRSTPAFRGGTRITQPSPRRESLKRARPDPEDLVSMPDGTTMLKDAFHVLRSTSHQKLGRSLHGCAALVRSSISSLEWKQLDAWIAPLVNRKRHAAACADNLMSVLLDHAAARMNLSPATVLARIVQERTARWLLIKPAK
jgi:hypothetical protein